MGFKGRISFKTYNPQKPTKWGLRVYVLCDSENGYISTFEPYFGQPTTANLPYPQMPFTVRIVLHLVDQLLEKADGSGYHVYTDRFYTSILLANQLLQKQIHLTGTVQKNRVGLPSDLKKLKLKNHEIKVYRHQDEVMTLAWQDKRLILMLSTWHNADTTIRKRWINGEEIEVIKPTVVCDYTSKMGGVDRADHYCASYSFTRKTPKMVVKNVLLAFGSLCGEFIYFIQGASSSSNCRKTTQIQKQTHCTTCWNCEKHNKQTRKA